MRRGKTEEIKRRKRFWFRWSLLEYIDGSHPSSLYAHVATTPVLHTYDTLHKEIYPRCNCVGNLFLPHHLFSEVGRPTASLFSMTQIERGGREAVGYRFSRAWGSHWQTGGGLGELAAWNMTSSSITRRHLLCVSYIFFCIYRFRLLLLHNNSREAIYIRRYFKGFCECACDLNV